MKLTIEHLRGSVRPFTLPFQKGKTMTLVYGENGTGKTTICDAFEFLSVGKIGSLDNRGLGTTRKYWASQGKDSSDVQVILEDSSGNTCTATISGATVLVTPRGSEPKVEVLRRSQILSLIEAKPAERYNAISKFIDVSSIESSENNLRNLIRTVERNQEQAIARVQENSETIQQFWESAGKPGVGPFEWAEAESSKVPDTHSDDIAHINELKAAYNLLKSQLPIIAAAQKTVSTSSGELEEAIKKVEEALQTVAVGTDDIVNILQTAKPYLQKHTDLSKCPLCESAENINGLSGRVQERLDEFTRFQQAQTTKTVKAISKQKAEQKLESLLEIAQKCADDFKKCCEKYTWPEDVKIPDTDLLADHSEWEDWFETHKDLSTSWTNVEKEWQDKEQFISTLKKAHTTYTSNKQDLVEQNSLLPALKSALEVMMEERRSFTDDILLGIADEVGRLYEIVHPGEGLDKISLMLHPTKRASLEIGASFNGLTDTPPQAYFSESHLDTLGLCTFLALAAMENPSETILVLDDVLASIDEPHIERLIEMLYRETKSFRHTVITTHYRPWREKFRWGWLKDEQCHFIELSKWTSAEGLTLINSIPDLDRLRSLLTDSPMDPQLVCAKAGVILEAALDFLTQLYQCSVPRKPGGRYTLGELLPAIKKKLRDALKIEVMTGTATDGTPTYIEYQLKPVLDELERIAQARNVLGCHFNELSYDLLDSDATNFGNKVLELMTNLADETNGWPKNNRSGSYWATSGETRKLHPLTVPR